MNPIYNHVFSLVFLLKVTTLNQCFPACVVNWYFLTKTVSAFLISPTSATFPARLIFLGVSVLIILGNKHKWRGSSYFNFLTKPWQEEHFSCLRNWGICITDFASPNTFLPQCSCTAHLCVLYISVIAFDCEMSSCNCVNLIAIQPLHHPSRSWSFLPLAGSEGVDLVHCFKWYPITNYMQSA